MSVSLRAAAWDALAQSDVDEKLRQIAALRAADWPVGTIRSDPSLIVPGRPLRPLLVPASKVSRRSMTTLEGRAALIHALAHIEFNAVNLALDAVVRFDGMPERYYRDWIGVACEEAYHFALLRAHLTKLGYGYGDFPAHDGLWEMAEKTKADVLARIALVPRTLEARGLDASPLVRAKLVQAGDGEAASIMDIILRDEIGHVGIGNRWYRWLCQKRGIDHRATYQRLALEFDAPTLRGPFNVEARRQAGFDEDELRALEAR